MQRNTKMTQTKHTPLLTSIKCWGVGIDNKVNGEAQFKMEGVRGAKEAEEYINRACNAHNDLVGALQNIMNGFATCQITSDCDETLLHALDLANTG